VPAPFTTYPNLVYSPHTYTHVFTADAEAGAPPASSPYPTSYDQAYQVADAEARDFGAALVPTEYGNSPSEDATVLAGETAAQDRAMAGSALWAWKSECNHAPDCTNVWGVYAGDPRPHPAENLPLIPSRVTYESRAYPRATAGTLTSFAYDPSTGRFSMTATAQRGGGAPTIVFIPAHDRGNVTVTGHASLRTLTRLPDGNQLASVIPTSAGPYGVAVSAQGR
jgi:hypothetical protein